MSESAFSVACKGMEKTNEMVMSENIKCFIFIIGKDTNYFRPSRSSLEIVLLVFFTLAFSEPKR